MPGAHRRTALSATYLHALLRGVRVLSWEWVAACCQPGSCRESDYEITVRILGCQICESFIARHLLSKCKDYVSFIARRPQSDCKIVAFAPTALLHHHYPIP